MCLYCTVGPRFRLRWHAVSAAALRPNRFAALPPTPLLELLSPPKTKEERWQRQ